MKHLPWFAVIVLCLSSGCVSNPVAPLSIGQQVDFKQLEDQNGNDFVHQDTMKLVLYVNGMSARDLVRESLDTINTDCMTEGRVVYLANISTMPSLISRLIAIPRMRDYSYPIWLDRDGFATEVLPVQEDAVTVLTIDHQTITGTDYFSEVLALSERLAQKCGTASQDSTD